MSNSEDKPGQSADAQKHLTNAIMQAMPDSRQQTFEEIYGPPENFLEIEVSTGPFSFCHPTRRCTSPETLSQPSRSAILRLMA